MSATGKLAAIDSLLSAIAIERVRNQVFTDDVSSQVAALLMEFSTDGAGTGPPIRC